MLDLFVESSPSQELREIFEKFNLTISPRPPLEGEGLVVRGDCCAQNLLQFLQYFQVAENVPDCLGLAFQDSPLRGDWISRDGGIAQVADEGAYESSLREAGLYFARQLETFKKNAARPFVCTQNWKPQGALFLDRDGILNIDGGYQHQFAKMSMIDEMIPTISWANKENIPVVVLTNQSGVARGFYHETDLAPLHREMTEYFGSRGALISRFYYCPFHPQGEVKKYALHSERRKPGIGMACQAAVELGLDLSRSLMVGDKFSDCLGHVGMKSIILGAKQALPAGHDRAESYEDIKKLVMKFFSMC